MDPLEQTEKNKIAIYNMDKHIQGELRELSAVV